MGYNRSGKVRQERLKRRKKYEQRLAAKAGQTGQSPASAKKQ
jgi:hypothetical protein